MAILAFQKPDKVLMLEADNTFGKFEFRPLEPGYGVTIGNALRRILLSGLEGFAICNIRIDGVQHEFATIPGVREDVTNIILNLKKVRLKRMLQGHAARAQRFRYCHPLNFQGRDDQQGGQGPEDRWRSIVLRILMEEKRYVKNW